MALSLGGCFQLARFPCTTSTNIAPLPAVPPELEACRTGRTCKGNGQRTWKKPGKIAWKRRWERPWQRPWTWKRRKKGARKTTPKELASTGEKGGMDWGRRAAHWNLEHDSTHQTLSIRMFDGRT